jgi:flagellar motor switch protein FliN
MSDNTQIVTEVMAACNAGAEEAAAAIGRAFECEIQLAVDQHGTLESPATPLDLDGPGLIVFLKADQEAVVVTIPAGTGFLPPWCIAPDASGESRLATLAQELSMTVLPDTWLTNEFRACWATNLAEALGQGGVPQDAVSIPLTVRRAGQAAGTLALIWPVKNPQGLFAAPAEPQQAPQPAEQPAVKQRHMPSHNSRDLPPYTRSLLRIKVPVVVTLAEKRQKLSRIIELGPGSIIQFDKSCEEMLDLEVANRPVALGEAVKIGDKFGLRITAMALPDERFHPVTPTKAAG